MRENLLNCPEDTHSWFTAWKLYTAPNGCYAAKRDIRYDIHFDEPRNPQQIAFSNDRYRLMHEIYQKHPSPIQTPRWYRSPENEVEVLYWTKRIDEYVSATHDNIFLALLGISVKPFTDMSKTFDKIQQDRQNPLFVSGIDPTNNNSEADVFKVQQDHFECMRKEGIDCFSGKSYQMQIDEMAELYKVKVTEEKSTLSPQDLESLSNSKITFGLTKDNITHIESSLAAKDYDATYAHYFWVQMGKDCNWEPLTLALYYFRYRDFKAQVYDPPLNPVSPAIVRDITHDWLRSIGFKCLAENIVYSFGHIGIERMQNEACAWKVSYVKDRKKYAVEFMKYQHELLKVMSDNPITKTEPSEFAATWKRVTAVNLKIEAKIAHEWLLAKGFKFCGEMENMAGADYVLYFPKHVSFFIKKTWRGIMIDENGEPKRRYSIGTLESSFLGNIPKELLGYAIVVGEDNHPKGAHDDWDYALHVKTKEEVEGFIKEHLAQ